MIFDESINARSATRKDLDDLKAKDPEVYRVVMQGLVITRSIKSCLNEKVDEITKGFHARLERRKKP